MCLEKLQLGRYFPKEPCKCELLKRIPVKPLNILDIIVVGNFKIDNRELASFLLCLYSIH